MDKCERWEIKIAGTVQGVGFRPFVYRQAFELGLVGSVRNTPEGVTVEAQGTEEALAKFIEKLSSEKPPLAEITGFRYTTIAPKDDKEFTIQLSTSSAGSLKPAISPDVATCDDCLSELADPTDRRHRYPFINCTNCGPRYTIIEGFPYDRPKTSMRIFDMCPACAAEYANPVDRRFHAQPNACPTCGPRLTAIQSQERSTFRWYRKNCDPVAQALFCIRSGGIVAIKGLGGFHLACDAHNQDAVQRLRVRKHRDERPFAVMVRDLDAAHMICHLDENEAALLTSPRRPIVLARKRDGIDIAEAVAPCNKMLGVMLPYTPLHHLLFLENLTPYEHQRGASDILFDGHGGRQKNGRGQSPLVFVMTSANFSDEPIVKDEGEAQAKLGSIADLFLTHNRPIYMRTDDSVVRVIDGTPTIMRRARGYVPTSLTLSAPAPQILAMGGDIKNAFCLTKGKDAYLSQHIGDLANPETHEHFEHTVEHLTELLKISPKIVAYDMHPDYYSSQYGRRRASTHVEVQHHHAHIASCMAEHGLPDEPVIGIALDGAGYGPDGTIWGGEILRARYSNYERMGRLTPVPQPGGDTAARDCWRMACAYLEREMLAKLPTLNAIDRNDIALVYQAIDKAINVPFTSSMGRLFDAAAAIVGIAMHNAFEGQAAMMLEQCADESEGRCYDYAVLENDGIKEIDFSITLRAMVNDVLSAMPTAIMSARFHNTVAKALVDAVDRIGGNEPIVLSGGCMQNARLLTKLMSALLSRGRHVYTHRLVPPNDGGLSLGQAAIAAYS